MKKSRLGIISICGLLIGLSNSAYARYDYTYYVENNTDSSMNVNVSTADLKCIQEDTISGLPLTLAAHQTGNFKFEGNDGAIGHCFHKDKAFVLVATPTSSSTTASSITVQLNRTYKQNSGYPITYTWQSEVVQASSTKSNSLSLTSATCNGNDCLNTWYNVPGDNTTRIQLSYHGGDISVSDVKTIGLGDATVTNGYGKAVGGDGSIDLSDGPFVIHFSKTQAECRFNDGLLTCDKGVSYTYTDSDQLVFVCSQKYNGSDKCPWITADTATNVANSVNAADIYTA
ncbi:hypothetical protein L3V82_05570 [Thiotrichales bacterium 19S3-7]|nr:hypothetical protein [Thiotrichales bacterium 19S3-7]MCF6801562.1 hypothetical protein [Thiotrichales bacterium 19S3-11]